jgi:hypothetical protein
MKLSQHITHDLSNVLADTTILVESRMGGVPSTQQSWGLGSQDL